MTDRPVASDHQPAADAVVQISTATLALSPGARPASTDADTRSGLRQTPVLDPGQETAGDPAACGNGADRTVGDTQVQELRGQVERLRSTITALRAELDSARRAHRDDIAAIGRALLREAEDRDWCEDYDQVIDDLNEQLSVALPERVRAWDVSFDLCVTVHIPNARNADDARERAAELASDIEDAVQALPHVTTADAEGSDDFAVTEA